MGLFIKRRVSRVSANCFSQCRHDERGDGPLPPGLALEDDFSSHPKTGKNGDLYQNNFDQYNNSDPFEIPDDLFDNGGVIQNQTMEQSRGFQSGNFDFGHTSTNLDLYQNTFNQYNNSRRGRASSREEELVVSLPTSARNAGMMKEDGTGLFTRRRVGRVAAS